MQYRKIKELKKMEGNPRQIKPEDLTILMESIENNPDYFEARPLILSDRTGELVIIGGNMRYEAAKKLGKSEVPTHLIENLSEEREREIMIRDNVNNGEWDWDILANDWEEEDLESWGVELPLGKEPQEQGEVDFSEELNEEHNYVVLYFDNEVSWLQLLSLYPLDSVQALDSKPGFKKVGVGRVVNGEKFINEITGFGNAQ